jgi:hypothetical protein
LPPKIRGMAYTLVITDTPDQESFERGLPYEKFLLGPSCASAPLELQSYGEMITPDSCIARIEPVHIHAARDHLVLTNPSILDLKIDEANALFEAVKDIFSEMSVHVFRPTIHRWFMECPNFSSLSTVSTHQAEGRNIDHWMPSDTTIEGIARQWRKWQNEIQMIWFNHPVNESREIQGLLPINSVWISGIGSLNQLEPHLNIKNASLLHSFDGCLSTLANYLNKPHQTASLPHSMNNTISLISLKDSQTPELWHRACEALIQGSIQEIMLIDFPEGQERVQSLTQNDLPTQGFAFWKKSVTPPLEEMLSR